MATDPRAQLGDRYEIVSELRHDDHSTTWLGRHRTLGRDVSITVLHANTPAERSILNLMAADARILGMVRHEHVLPVLDTRWLSTDELAIVRPRVRGSTLRNVISGAGTLSPKRAEELLREIGTTLEWSSRNGIVHRYIDPDSVCVQQGSKKILISFGPPAVLEEELEEAAQPRTSMRMLRHCSDSNTLALLGFEMLTGHEPTGGEGSLRLLRPDVPAPMASAIDEGLRCDGQAAMMPLSAFLARMGGTGKPVPYSDRKVVEAQVAPTPLLARAQPEEERPGRSPGSGLRVAMTMLVLVVLAIGAWAIMTNGRHRRGPTAGRRDTGTTAAGDVSIDTRPAGPGILTDSNGRTRPAAPATAVTPAPAPAATTPPVTGAQPPVSVPPQAPPTTQPVNPADPCTSPAAADQRRCLDTRLTESDRGLNATYATLMRRLSAQDPAAAAALRDQQRAWLEQRDRACRNAGSGPLWASDRAQCLAQQSATREQELAAQLSKLQ